MLQGYKTWIGLIITALGATGALAKMGLDEGSAGQIVDSVMTLVGLLVSAYGNWDAHRRLNQ